jgi:hypothetical protein
MFLFFTALAIYRQLFEQLSRRLKYVYLSVLSVKSETPVSAEGKESKYSIALQYAAALPYRVRQRLYS